MTCDMVSFRTGNVAFLPLASKTEIVSALPSDVVVAQMVVEYFRIVESFIAVEPLTIL
jgi:ribosome-associated toxin RatA of RatAB toxin-antitoxin module